jgi:hypothetical protein
MSVPVTFITRFFQLVSERKFAEAERVLERITLKLKRNEKQQFNQGYLTALNGIILTYRSSHNTYDFFNNLQFYDTKTLKKHRIDFLEYSKRRFHGNYDRGYFTALSDYLRVYIKTKKSANK